MFSAYVKKVLSINCTIISCVYNLLVSPPDILTNPSSSTVVFYDNAQFRCVARSCELMDIVWKKAGSQRLPSTAVVTNIPSNVNEIISVLKITEAIGYYSGQYYCEVKNSAGTVISSLATLYVKGMYVCMYVAMYVYYNIVFNANIMHA